MENQNTPFDFNEFSSLDIKALLLKIVSYWKWFIISLILAYFVIKYINDYQKRLYSIDSLITVKDEQNPIFSSSTNIAFNWGGTSDQVETVKTILKSRTHNEKVVQEKQFYIEYLREGKYRLEDVYGKTPFRISVDTSHFQLINTLFKIEFIAASKVRISINFGENTKKELLNYHTSKKQIYSINERIYNQEFPIGKIQTDFFSFEIKRLGTLQLNKEYLVRFNDFNATVGRYRNIEVKTAKKGTSLIQLKLSGTNKNLLVDYINSTVKVLEKDQIKAKIRYAVKTKDYIDTLFNAISGNLKTIEKDLGDYKKQQNIYNLSEEGAVLFNDATSLDAQIQHLNDRLDYFQNLNSYIRKHEKFDSNSIPVPVVIEIEDSKISKSISTLIAKYKLRENLLQTVNSDFPTIKAINSDIELERNALLENISMLRVETANRLSRIKSRLNINKNKLKKLPQKEQKLLSYQRKYAITEQNYNYLKQKSYEAGTAIASNVSDIKIIDTAKDIGQTYHSPNKKMNMLVGLLIALLMPLLFVLLKEFLNNKIQTVEEIEKGFKIPILGVIGNKTQETSLVVLDYPKSVIAEAYRSLRSNLQFMLKRETKSHVILLTSSISGEGKTLTAINLASIFALSGKKTILVGVDLRKPKLAEDFGLNNKIGLSHLLINKKTIEDVVQKSTHDNLDVLLSGPVPPNPSELLLSAETSKMLTYLREHYEYIILDAPPIGAVSDAQELFQYADNILYLIRQGYTDKGLLKMIETKYERKEVTNVSYVLNDFTFSKRHGYGYGYGGYGYGYGYYEKEKQPFYKRIFQKKS